MNIDKLKKACDRRFFIFVTVVFLVSFIGGLVWFWGETWAQGEQGRLSRLVAEKFQDEDQIAMEDEDETSKLTQEEKTSDILSSPAVLGEMTETVTEETTFQRQFD
jgi:hypothetical protein